MKELLTEVTTNKSLEEVEKALKKSLEDISFGVLAELNLGEKMRAKGINYIGELKAFEVCNPLYANKVLSYEENIKYLLPCKITLSRKGDITTLGMVDFLGFDGLITDEARGVAKDIFEKLTNALNNSVL